MGKSNTAAEPSMEEILASIRRIIADEDPAAKQPQAAVPVPPPPPPSPPATPPAATEEDVLDLAMVRAEAAVVAETKPESKPQPQPAAPDDVAFDDSMPDEPEPPVPELPPAREAFSAPHVSFVAAGRTPAPARVTENSEGLLSGRTTEAVSNAFGALSSAIFSRDARTIEDLTKELLRPMVKEWLDDNLPTLVERLVREEIERVARGRR
jgi:cell pole-organizing protein PopZ